MKIKYFFIIISLLWAMHLSAQNDFISTVGSYQSVLGIFNDNLYLTYEVTKEKSPFYSIQLAKFDGKNVEFINNPDSGIGILVNNGTAIFNNSFLFSYQNASKKNKLAVLRNNQIKLFNLPKGIKEIRLSNIIIGNKIYLHGICNEFDVKHLTFDGMEFGNVDDTELPDVLGVTNDHFSYKGKDYFGFLTKKPSFKYAELVGNKLVYKNVFPSSRNTILFKNEIYFNQEGNNSWWDDIMKTTAAAQAKYTEAAMAKHKYQYPQLAKFDGEKTIAIKNLNDTSGLDVRSDGFYKYNDALYFFYALGEHKTVLAKYDGQNITLIKDTVTKNGYYSLLPFEFNGKLYFEFNVNGTNRNALLEFDGQTFKKIDNPIANKKISLSTALNFKGKLYFTLFGDGVTRLAYLNEGKITMVDNCDDNMYNGIGFGMVNYQGNLIFIYQSLLGKYDGEKISLIKDSGWKKE